MKATVDFKQKEVFTANDHSRIILRPAQTFDAKDIVESVASIIEQGAYIQKERVRSIEEEISFIEEMKALNNMYIVVEINGVARGIARVIRGELAMKRHTGLFRTWLHEDAQGKGIGKKVMEYTLAWCQRYHLHKLCLTVFSSNTVAAGLYKKAGFVTEGVQKEQAIINQQYVDEIFMAYFFKEAREEESI